MSDSETEAMDHFPIMSHDDLPLNDRNEKKKKEKCNFTNRKRILIAAFIFIAMAFTLFLTLGSILAENSTAISKINDEHKLLGAFISIPSISGSESSMGEAIYEWLKVRGWTLVRQSVTSTTFNVFAHKGNTNPRLIVNSHIDTVPPFIPYSEDENLIFGRGACDAKGPIVAQLFAVEQLLAEGKIDPTDIGLLFVVEEETTSNGMKKANELGLTPKYLLVGEPTERKLGSGHKGSISFLIESFGKESHSGYPELGKSAISPLIRTLEELENASWPNDPYFGQTTLNIGKISGGVAANVVPAYANATIFIRGSVPFQQIQTQVAAIVGDSYKLTYTAQNDPFKCNVVPGFETEVFSYGTDLPSFIGNHKSYLFGPGSILVAHTDGEYISKAELTATIADYKNLILTILAQG